MARIRWTCPTSVKVTRSIDYRERQSHARGVYPTHDTSHMRAARVKQEEETDKNNGRVA